MEVAGHINGVVNDHVELLGTIMTPICRKKPSDREMNIPEKTGFPMGLAQPFEQAVRVALLTLSTSMAPGIVKP